MNPVTAQLRPAIMALLVLTLITGVIYPLAITGIAQILLPTQANGSLIVAGSQIRGTTLIGQSFTNPAYFWGRPSATSPFPYNAAASAGSNYGPGSSALIDQAQRRMIALHAADPTNTQPIPVDLVTASGSGLDPHISPAAAIYQAERVARARKLDRAQIQALIEAHTEGRWLGIFGEPRVNVLTLNLALDALQ
ncbi:MAG TPA: potassium-transporting ATPase subunit KdpC [Roseiflexaceae bacterium]|nr:potassium-transporting ATPase subunit KdpC [Roseiflexaceae bacterium]